jgi:putative endonuclease
MTENNIMPYYTYVLASGRNGTLYVGGTNNIARRIHEHRTGDTPGFTKRYGVKKLVYVETYDDVRLAIQREKTFKRWSRSWKLALIEEHNPQWLDLFETINS